MPGKKPLHFRPATEKDAAALAALHTAVAIHLTESHGNGPWSAHSSEKGVLAAMRGSHIFVGQNSGEIIATFRLATKKPWAIDTAYFTKCQKPLYLLAMAVTPPMQRRGIGQRCIQEASRIAKAWPADAIRLDAYDANAGAGGFFMPAAATRSGAVAPIATLP